MLDFTIYKISYAKEAQMGLHWDKVENDAEGHFVLKDVLLKQDFVCDRLFKTNSNGEVLKKFPVYIRQQSEDVTLLQLHNSVIKTLVQKDEKSADPTKYTAHDEESNPYCYVIIDNRKGVGQIAIQQSSAWGNPDNVKHVLEQSLTRMMQQLKESGLRVCITPKMRPTEIWAFVNERLKKGDSIKRIVFEFLNRKNAEVTDIPKLTGRINGLLTIVEKTGGKKGQIKIESGSSPLEMKRRNRDFREIIRLCSSQGYKLLIYFKKFKVYRCNESVKADFEMDPELLSDFISNTKEVDIDERVEPENQKGIFGIIRWLDFVRDETKEFEDAEKVHKPREDRDKA